MEALIEPAQGIRVHDNQLDREVEHIVGRLAVPPGRII